MSLVTDAHSALKGSRKSDPRHVTTQTIIFQHHGSVTLVDVACLVTWRSGAQSLVVVAPLSLLRWRTAGMVKFAAETLGRPCSLQERACLFVDCGVWVR